MTSEARDFIQNRTFDEIAVGDSTGNLYVSEDSGDSFVTVANNLPPVYSVRFG